MVIGTKYKILDPVQEATTEDLGLAPRLDSLDGKVVGLFTNGKMNSAELLECVAEVLHERYDLQGVVRGPSSEHRFVFKGVTPDEGLRMGFYWGLSLENIETCDTIILAIGD